MVARDHIHIPTVKEKRQMGERCFWTIFPYLIFISIRKVDVQNMFYCKFCLQGVSN